MSCIISNGTKRTCEFSAGGLKSIYLANYDEVSEVGYDATGMVTGFTMTSGSTFYNFDFLKDTASYTQELTVGTGNKFYTQNVNFNLSSASEIVDTLEDGVQTAQEAQELQNLIDQLLIGKFIVIAVDKSQKIKIFGAENGLEASAGNLESGAAGGDFNGQSITLTGEETKGSPVVDSIDTIPV